MERSSDSLAIDSGYLQYFGLARAPFAALADAGEQFQCEQYLLLMEHLQFAAANADSLVVVCGADGSGKSTLIDRFTGSLRDEVSCVSIDAALHQGVAPFYRTFLQQIGFDQITGTASELGNITREFLVCRGIASDHVLVIVDNTHLVDPRILEQLRRLCDIRIKDRRALSVVLFGNADIVRVVDSPAMRQAAFASHVVFNIRSFGEIETAGYIRHRLELAGAADGGMFPDPVCALIHRYSGGIPRRINQLAADALEEAQRQNSRVVSNEVVRAIINRQRLLPHLTLLPGKGRRRSDSRSDAAAAPAVAEAPAHAQQLAELTARVDDLEMARSQALQEVDARNREIQLLRDELGAREKEAGNLSRSVAAHAAVIARLEQALSERAALLIASESEVKRLAAELSQALRSRELVQERLDNAQHRAVEAAAQEQAVPQLRAALAKSAVERDALRKEVETERAARQSADRARDEAMAAARQLDAELGSARERAFSAYALERYVAQLQKALEERTGELNARAQAVADLEAQVRKLRHESESVRIRALISRSVTGPAARPADARTSAARRAHSSQAVSLYEHSLAQIPAYRLLKEHDPGFHDGWLKEYQLLLGQGLSDKQINDALRGSQARWMERHLVRASDVAVVAYMRLLIEQIDQFLLDGTEPCLSFLVPQPRPAKGVALPYCEQMAARELELLALVLSSRDARRSRPKESDVWPDLEPIFAGLFEAHGADNVAAIENSFDPARDRRVLGNVSRTLFLRILELPEARAAAALRWMLVAK